MGPDAHADPRRHEDRRPRHARHPHLCRARVQGSRPGPGRHRGRRRGHQPAVLLADDQLRHPLEPRPPRTAGRPHPPLRPGARLPHLQLRGAEHPRRPRAAKAARPARAKSARTWAPTRCSTSSARSFRRTCWRSCSGRCTPGRPTNTRFRTASSATSAPNGSGRSPNRPWKDWPRRNSTSRPSSASRPRPRNGGWCPRSSSSSSSRPPPRPACIPRRPPETATVYRIGKVPRNLLPVGDRQEHRFGRLGREYAKIVFDKAMLAKRPDPGMGHAGPSALRGRPHRPARSAPRTIAPRCRLLRSAPH